MLKFQMKLKLEAKLKLKLNLLAKAQRRIGSLCTRSFGLLTLNFKLLLSCLKDI